MNLFLMIYVDDFELSGPTENLKIGWETFAASGFKFVEEQPPGLFLGCIHEPLETVINGVTARRFAYNVQAYLEDTVKRYCELVLDQTGQKVNLSTKARVRRSFSPRTVRIRHQIGR